MTNNPFLESPEQLNRFFPASLHKIMFHIFQNISKCSIYELVPFIHKNTCKLFDVIPDKDKKGRIIVKKCFFLHEEVVEVFHKYVYIPTIEKLSFHLAHVRILGSMEYGKNINDCFCANASKKIYINFKKDHVENLAKRLL